MTDFTTIIGTGGVLVHQDRPADILRPEERVLFPHRPHLYLDQQYLLSAMGLLATEEPDVAFDLLQRTLVDITKA